MIVTFLLIIADDNGATPKCVEKKGKKRKGTMLSEKMHLAVV
jgi:hypothetical protein